MSAKWPVEVSKNDMQLSSPENEQAPTSFEERQEFHAGRDQEQLRRANFWLLLAVFLPIVVAFVVLYRNRLSVPTMMITE